MELQKFITKKKGNEIQTEQKFIQVDSDFQISLEQLQELFDTDPSKANEKLKQLGGISHICEKLQTDINRGIDVKNQQLFDKRIQFYGKNSAAKKQSKSILALIFEQFEDLMLKILVIAAIVSVIVGILKDGWSSGWMDGVSIFVAVILIVSVTATNNYVKEKQFQKLSDKLEQRDVKVVRNGEEQQMSVYELTVGDIMYIQVGEIFPVDGILIQGNEVTLDLSSETGESNLIKKVPALEIEQNSSKNYKENPILVSGGKMTEGQGTMLVCAVGKHTQQGKIRETLEVEKEDTPLQMKLEMVANQIGKLGLYTAIATFIILILHLIYSLIMGQVNFSTDGKVTYILKYLVNAVTIGVAIVVVAVPEGLPLSVTIAYAYSVGKMKDENNLVRDLASCEIMGGANNICSDKTGTLTENKMKVTQLFIEQNIKPEEKIIPQEISKGTIKLFCETICQNSTADIEWDQEINDFKQLGSKTECGLLQACKSLQQDYKEIRDTKKYGKVIPFSSDRKRMSTIYQSDDVFRVATKGAAEIVLEKCTKIIDETGKTIPLTKEIKTKIYNDVITHFATQTLRTISIAYKDIDLDTDLQKMDHDFFESDLTLIGIAGIKDKLRAGVEKAVAQCTNAGITVRMVTGDNVITAEAIAKECGILPKNYKRGNEDDYTVMEGQQFIKLVGKINYQTIKKKDGDDEKEIKKINGVENAEKFYEIQSQLRVLARAKPIDKLTLVAGLIKLKQIVAATGDGSNDAPALKNADIGFAMGIQGTEIAKQAAGIILLDDNFCSIVTACKWGRNVYDSVRKFIQFQLTVNIVALFMAVLGATIIKESPLNSVQMLWVNLIMDTFASLALATEAPTDELLDRKPYKREESMVNDTMWKIIVMQAVYQIIVLVLVLFEGPTLFNVASSFDNDPFKTEKGYHFTLFFQIFVFMQIFNEINCRKLENKQKNVFKGFFRNPMFIFILVLTIIVQMMFVEFGSGYIKCSPLSWQQNLICMVIAAAGLVWGFFIRFIPDGFFGKINYFAAKSKLKPELDIHASVEQRLLHDEENDNEMENLKVSVRHHKSVINLVRSSYMKRIRRGNTLNTSNKISVEQRLINRISNKKI